MSSWSLSDSSKILSRDSHAGIQSLSIPRVLSQALVDTSYHLQLLLWIGSRCQLSSIQSTCQDIHFSVFLPLHIADG